MVETESAALRHPHAGREGGNSGAPMRLCNTDWRKKKLIDSQKQTYAAQLVWENTLFFGFEENK